MSFSDSCQRSVGEHWPAEPFHDPADAPADTEGEDADHYGVRCGGRYCVYSVRCATALSCSTVNGSEVCDYVSCAQDCWDIDGDRTNGCESLCIRFSDTDATCDGIDDDCNGLVDDGVDFCSDGENCGRCGRNCGGRPHASATCHSAGSATTCDDSNATCDIDTCSPEHYDLNGVYLDGCEFACVKTRRTVSTDPATLVF